jgi:hypothetical protein
MEDSMQFKNLIFPFALLVLIGVSACSASEESEFVGTWQRDSGNDGVKCLISHQARNQYSVTFTNNSTGAQEELIAFFKYGKLSLKDGREATFDKKTGKMNFNGQDFTKK